MSSGQRLLSLINNQLPDIVQKEQSNSNSIHLYSTGTYWVAFEKSAFQLQHACKAGQAAALQCVGHPFPVVMVSIPLQALPEVKKKCTSSRSGQEYHLLTTPGFSSEAYRRWHRRLIYDL